MTPRLPGGDGPGRSGAPHRAGARELVARADVILYDLLIGPEVLVLGPRYDA